MSHAPGVYWIRLRGHAPEVAFWDSQSQGWVLTGSEDILVDNPAEIVVLAGPLRPPSG